MSSLTDEQEKALRDLNSAAEALKKSVGGKAGESLEKKYGEAYRRCYALGLKHYPLIMGRTTR